ncbi:MAG: SDR family NAD(P)-dependent oxidoreductase [Halobacteriales archaeon]|nr:SDR family NAD(P)-dependent oxidoreductase [Halobacteriales archaeon]
MTKTAVIAGVGPGLGASIAEKFVSEDCAVALLARSEDYLDEFTMTLRDRGADAIGIPTDITQADQVDHAIDRVHEELGSVDVLVNHAGGGGWQGIRDLSAEAFEGAWRTCAHGAFLCSKAVLDDMLAAGDGAILFSGATSAIRGRGGSAGFSSAKFAVRGLAQSMAQELGPQGITVAHVVLDGGILPPNRDVDDPAEYLDPDDIAETYWHLVEDDPATMNFEVHVTNGNGTIEFI